MLNLLKINKRKILLSVIAAISIFFVITPTITPFTNIFAQECSPQTLGCAPYSGAQSGFWQCSGCTQNNCCTAGGGTTTHCISGCGGSSGGGCEDRTPILSFIGPSGVVPPGYYTIGYGVADYGNNCIGGNLYGYRLYLDTTCTNHYTVELFSLNVYIPKGQTYCFVGFFTNGGHWSNPAYTSMTGMVPPTISAAGLIGQDVCGNMTSGRVGSPGVTNPFTYQVSYNPNNLSANLHPTNHTLVLLPKTGAYAENREYIDWGTAYSKSIYARTFTFFYYTVNNVRYTMAMNQSGNWTFANGTTLTNDTGTATLLDIGTESQYTYDTTTKNSSSRFKIRIENTMANGQYSLYAATFVHSGDGNSIISSYGQEIVGQNFVLKKVADWNVDTIAPSLNIGNPVVQQDGSFNVNWQMSDNLGINQLHSYVSADVSGAVLQDTTGGYNVNALSSPPTIPTTPSNTGLTPSSQQNRNYRDLTAGLYAGYTFTAQVRDLGCNTANSTLVKANSQPWVMDIGGHTSGKLGIPISKIPNIPALQIPQFNINSNSFLSSYQSISGTTSLPQQRASKFDQYITNYLNEASDEYTINQSSGFYEFLDVNTRRNVQTSNLFAFTGNRNISGNISSNFSLTPGTNRYAVAINGDLNIAANTVCDANAIILVNGALSFTPNFSSVNNSACIFVSRGNVTINAGTHQSNGIGLNDQTKANYDSIDAFIITDGTIHSPKDQPNLTFIGDGLRVKGGLFGTQLNIERNLNEVKNQIQPALVIEYDPRFKQIFKDILDYRRFSIRELGLE